MNLLQITKPENGEIAAKIPIWLFKTSFGVGTLLCVLGLAFPNCELLIIGGFFYTIIAFIINAIVFFALMISCFVFIGHGNEIMLNTLLLLVNIPITILYSYLILSGVTLL